MIDPREFRRTIGLFGTGVTVLASGEGDELRAMTANAVTSLSLEPMLLIACIHKKARIVANLNKGWGFSVNILRQEQQPLSNYFAGAWHEDEPPHFDFVPMDGGPRLVGCSASIGCRLNELLPGGDHW
ncbi:MAG: flavin reductase family protein, partial [Anaerolineae bacterium]